MSKIQIQFDTTSFDEYMKNVIDQIDLSKGIMQSYAYDAMYEFMDYEHIVFRNNSQGAGGWQPLSTKTIRKRAARAGKKTDKKSISIGSLPILHETGTLEAGLFVRGSNGHDIQCETDSIQEGASGGSHPHFFGTVGELAEIHHYGIGVPERPVMIEPDQQTINSITHILGQGLQEIINVTD